MSRLLSEAERCSLLSIARRAVLARAAGGPPPTARESTGGLLERRGVFVTLRIRDELRGCIGTIVPDAPLIDAVARCAAAAASEDPRFPPLSIAETADLSISISALDPPFEIEDPEKIVLGHHGLVVSRGNRRGLLLPQVAIEQGWDRRRLLRETCRKAGLEPDAWKRGARVQAFTAEVFSEEGASSAPPSSRPPSPPRSG